MIRRTGVHALRRWPRRAARIAAACACLAAFASPVAAAPPFAVRTPPGGGTIDPALSSWSSPGADPAARRDVIVVLAGPPALDRLGRPAPAIDLAAPGRPGAGDDVAAASRAVAAVAAEQAPVRSRIQALGVPVLSAYGTVANGFLVSARPADVVRLAALPGVTEVIAAPNHRPALADAVPHIGADRVAASLGFDGRGVTIGIIDTGIDYFHASFGGPGTAAAYGSDDHAVVEAGSFPTAKVVGGHDFAGSQYGGSGAPTPDDDPVDENGHGTHVAGIAAGQAWAGRHGGVAPGARLVALKVFGASGSTNLAYDAIEWAVEAKLGLDVPGRAADIDVLNLSLGSAWAAPSSFEQLLIDRAVAAGIVVVGAAGNDGDVAFVTGGPGMAPSAIGVASTVGPGQLGDRVQAIVDGVVEDVEALEADARLTARAASLGRLQGGAIWLGRACDGDALPDGIAGRVALIERGDCTFRTKLSRAAAAGALAVVVVDNGGGIVTMAGDGGTIPIPAYMIGAAAGRRLHAALNAGAVVDIRFDASFNGRFPRASLVDTVSGFSSRGVTRSGTFKPDLAAPGTAIRAPAVGSGDRTATLSGTSMASPMVAGAAAVVVQAMRAAGHPLDGEPSERGVTPRDIRTLLTTTAVTDVKRVDHFDRGVAPFALRGAGRVALEQAVRVRTLLRPTGGEGALSFGALAAAEPWSGSQTFELRNLAAAPRRFALSVVGSGPGEATAGIVLAPAEPVVTVGPHATLRARLLAEIAPSALGRYTLRGGASAMNGDGRLEEAERDDYLVATEIDANGRPLAGGDVVRLPVWAFARGASAVSGPDVVTVPIGAADAAFELSNAGAQPGRAELFTHLATDAVEPSTARGTNAVHVGARVTGDGAARRIEIAVVFAGPSLAPFDVAVEASLDTNRDGAVDRVLTIDDDSAVTPSAPWSGTLVTVATDARGRGAAVVGPADVDINSRLVVLIAGADALGFPAGAAVAFDLAVETTARFGGGRVDSVPDGALRSGRLVAPLRFGRDDVPLDVGTPSLTIGPGERATAHVRLADGVVPENAQLLVLHPDDAPGEGDAHVISFRRAVPMTPSVGPPSPSPTALPSPSATSTARTPIAPSATATIRATPDATDPAPTPTATPFATEVPTDVPTDEPTRASRVPTIVLPVEPTATATPIVPVESTPTSRATVAASPTDPATLPAATRLAPTQARPTARTRRIFLPFAYTYVRRPRS